MLASVDFADSDYVLSRDEFDTDGPLVPRRVLRVFERHGPILNLHVGGQVIGTTAEHPFYVQDKGWTAAHELRAGDLIHLMDNGWIKVEGIAPSERYETVYNLEIEDDHTYFVGCPEWGFSVWVHNNYNSFYLLKKAIGPAGTGRVWHHIVEQRLVRIFGPNAIHSASNVVSVTNQVNQAIANYYSRVRGFTNGLTVRQWLTAQSFAQQDTFGRQILQRVLKGLPLL